MRYLPGLVSTDRGPWRCRTPPETRLSGALLLLCEYEINGPTAANVGAWAAEVIEDELVGAAGLFECIRQNRHALDGPLLVDCSRQLEDRALVPPKPRRVGRPWAIGIAENVAEEVAKSLTFLSLRPHP